MPAIKPCSPSLLPLQKLDWEKIIPYLGDAREAVARLDEEIKKNKHVINLFLWNEAVATVRSQCGGLSLKRVMLYVFSSFTEEKDAAFLKKSVFAKQAIDEALAWSRKKRLGKRFFCLIQARLKQDSLRPEDIGRFRKRQNWIGPRGCKIEDAYFYPPPASKIDSLFRNLETYLESKETDPLLQTAIGFAQFLIIHPFMDGNGRAARIFIPIYAMKRGLISHPALLLSAYFEDHRNEYFQKLYQLTETENWEDWIVFFLKGVILQAIHARRQGEKLNKMFETIKSLTGQKWAEKLFRTPLIQCKRNKAIDQLVRKKILIAQSKEHYIALPLFRAMS